MRTTLLLLQAGAALCFAAACSPQPTFKPVPSVKQLMQSAIEPSAEVVFEAVGTIISSSGVEEIAPKNDEEWATAHVPVRLQAFARRDGDVRRALR